MTVPGPAVSVPLEVEYEITPDDLYAFQWRAVFESPRGRRARRTPYILWFLAVLLFSAIPAIGADGFVISRMNFTFFVIVLPLVFLAQWFLETRMIRRAILELLKEEKPGKGQLGKHRIIVTENGIEESTAVSESRTSWAGVHRIEQSRDYIFIYVSPSAAHVIPKRAFGGIGPAEAFYQFCQARKEAAG